MHLYDSIRYGCFLTFGLGCGLMLLTNLIAFQELRPPKQLGFLWWHVVSISLSVLCLGIVSVESVAGRFGNPPTWRGALTLFGTTLFMVAQFIIFQVERKRLVHTRAVQQVNSCRSV